MGSFTIACPQCRREFRVNEELRGKRGKCPQCAHVFQLLPLEAVEEPIVAGRHAGAAAPMAPLSTAPRESQPAPATVANVEPTSESRQLPVPQRIEQLRREFSSAIQPVETSISYRLAAALVAVVMVLLPLVYIGIIACVAAVVLLHLVLDWHIITAVRGRAVIMAILLYSAPIAIGAILVLFMVKPLFARAPRQKGGRSITREEEPVLFAFVDRVCEAVGAPEPRRIDLDNQVNASASFRAGWWSMIRGNDLVLTIGLPLAAGLTTRQLAGVLAHEFGHFSQGAGMRLTYVIRTISHWFTRVVYERDSWDQWLAETSGAIDLRIGWILYVARACVWLTRKILWVLMMLGHATSGYMLRQMEVDADRHEARLAGSATFAETARRLHELNYGFQAALADLRSGYREGRLGDDLPLLAAHRSNKIPREAEQAIAEALASTATGWFDTHPADGARIASAAREQAAGVFHGRGPATALFMNFPAVSRLSTVEFYQEILGEEYNFEMLISAEELLARQAAEHSSQESLKLFWLGAPPLAQPLPQNHSDLEYSPAELREAFEAARGALAHTAPAAIRLLKEFDDLDSEAVQVAQARALLEAGFNLSGKEFPLKIANRTEASRHQSRIESGLGSVYSRLGDFLTAGTTRIDLAGRFFSRPPVELSEEGAALAEEYRRLTPLIACLSRQMPELLQLRNHRAALEILIHLIQNNPQHPPLIERTLDELKAARQVIMNLRQPLLGFDYPFDHARGAMTVAKYVVSEIPDAEDLGAVFDATHEMLDRLSTLYERALGRTCAAVLFAETSLGLPPLPIPETHDS